MIIKFKKKKKKKNFAKLLPDDYPKLQIILADHAPCNFSLE